mmetsp:Transcript_51081/g.143805  ORF Transcript_51081/g.143805 Transcript_51081/m.143805 type:complete len:215 (+) Transcript_51081:1694-2338(+)
MPRGHQAAAPGRQTRELGVAGRLHGVHRAAVPPHLPDERSADRAHADPAPRGAVPGLPLGAARPFPGGAGPAAPREPPGARERVRRAHADPVQPGDRADGALRLPPRQDPGGAQLPHGRLPAQQGEGAPRPAAELQQEPRADARSGARGEAAAPAIPHAHQPRGPRERALHLRHAPGGPEPGHAILAPEPGPRRLPGPQERVRALRQAPLRRAP